MICKKCHKVSETLKGFAKALKAQQRYFSLLTQSILIAECIEDEELLEIFRDLRQRIIDDKKRAKIAAVERLGYKVEPTSGGLL